MEKYKEIERSIIKKYRKEIWSRFTKAIKDYNLIEENDNIMVCISGGKDSFLMAKCIQELKRHGKILFNARYVVMDPGYNEYNLEYIKDNAKTLNVPIEIFKTNIFDSVENQKDPCYLCARMRRGYLYNHAKEIGCNKIALGHHYDDVIETNLINLFYAGEVKTMLPKLKSDNFEGISLIRPLYLIRERDIISWRNFNELKFINCACRFTEGCSLINDGTSKRKVIKEFIKKLEEKDPTIVKNIFRSMSNINLDCVIAYRKDGKYISKY